MIRWLDFLLVLYLVYQSGILPVGNDPIMVTGEKGGNVTLTCEFKDHKISQLELLDQRENIVCENEGCTGQSIKKGACDVIIKDLSFSDAGKYTLTVYYDDDQTELESKSRDYHLHIHVVYEVLTPRTKDIYGTFTMLNRLNLLLLLCFINCTEIFNITKGKKGDNIALPLNKNGANGIFRITMKKLEENGKSVTNTVCDNKKCSDQEKSGIILKNLSFRDAGKYTLNVFYDDDVRNVLEPQTIQYQLQICDEISVKTGEQLKLDVLFLNVSAVKHQIESSREDKEIWKRGHEVQNDRVTVRGSTLTINDFTASDAGTYIVLDSEGEILIMVTVTESGSAGDHKGNSVFSSAAPHHPAPQHWSLPVKLSVLFVIWVVMVLIAILCMFLLARMN